MTVSQATTGISGISKLCEVSGRLTSAWALLLVALGLVAFPAGSAHAAIAFDDVTSFGSPGCDPCDWTHTVTTGGSDRILVVAVTAETKTDQSIVSVTYNGLALTEIRQDHLSLQFRSSLWYLLDPPTGSAFTISADWDVMPNKFVGASLSFTGVDQTDPIDDTSNVGFGATGDSTSATVDVVTENADAWIVDAMVTKDFITIVAKSGRVERWNVNGGGPIWGAGSTLDTTGQGTGTYTMDWTILSAKQWAISAAALKPAVADPLEIVKRAFEVDGTPIPTGSTIPSPVEFKYLLYINNRGAATSDVSVRDVLEAAFQYQAGTIQVDNSVAECALTVCTAAEELAIFAAVDGAAFLTDAIDGDVASITGSTIDSGNENVANLRLDINANEVWAILFSVKMP